MTKSKLVYRVQWRDRVDTDGTARKKDALGKNIGLDGVDGVELH